MSVSTLILTHNEEVNLPHCLSSLTWCSDIVVLDSYSTDATEVIARESGARFVQRKFDDYGSQRNFGLNSIEYKYEWVLMIDADEVMTPELASEIQKAIKNADAEVCLFRFRIKYYFMGRWIRRSSGYPTWFGRLARKGKVNVDHCVNELLTTDGKIRVLKHHLLHFTFNKGFHSWVEKHNRYSTMEAEGLADGIISFPKWRETFNLDPAVRRGAIKKIFFKLPGRPILVFLTLYFLRLGCLDGIPGFTFCTLRAFYEYLIDCKVKEIRLRKRGLTL